MAEPYMGHTIGGLSHEHTEAIRNIQDLAAQTEEAAARAQAGAAAALASASDSRKYANTAQVAAEIAQSGFDTDLAVSKNLTTKRASNTTADIDADAVVLVDSDQNIKVVESVNLTVDITSSGANGLDTGSEANSTWYHLWVIYDGATISGLLSESAVSPTLPSGYTYKGYVGAVYNQSTGNFLSFVQLGRVASIAATKDVSAGTATSLTSFTPTIPTTAKTWNGNLHLFCDSATDGQWCRVAPSNTQGLTTIGHIQTSSRVDWTKYHYTSISIFTAQTLYYNISQLDSIDIWTVGYEF